MRHLRQKQVEHGGLWVAGSSRHPQPARRGFRMGKVNVIGTRVFEYPSTPPQIRVLSRRSIVDAGRLRTPPIRVGRREIPYWQESGWVRSGNTYTGRYGTRYGSWEGQINQRRGSNIELFIIHPPERLASHPHWVCFNSKGRGLYWLHFNQNPKSISGGILEMERILTEAFES